MRIDAIKFRVKVLIFVNFLDYFAHCGINDGVNDGSNRDLLFVEL